MKTLSELYNDIYAKNIKSLDELKDHADLYNQFEEAVYSFLCSPEVAKGIYKASSKYYSEHGNSDVKGTIQVDVVNENTKTTDRYNKVVSLNHGDLIHMYYTYLFTETKKKGAHKGEDFFTIIFNNPELDAWIPTTVKSFSNWIMDLSTTTKTDDSLDRSLSSDSSDSTTLGDVTPDTQKTPETKYISNVASHDIINSLADQFLLSHPEDFVSLNWFIQNPKAMYKPTELYNYFTEILQNHSPLETAKVVVGRTLEDLSIFNLETDTINLDEIDFCRILAILDQIKSINDKEAELTSASTEKEITSIKKRKKEVVAELSHWYERCKNRFQKNKTVLSYR